MPVPYRLRKHVDYQFAYSKSAKQSGQQMAVFFAVRPPDRRSTTPMARIGLTVPKTVGKAHERNRIKRRMRVIVHSQVSLLHSPVDVIVHPRRSVLTAEFQVLEREIAEIFARIQQMIDRRNGLPFPDRPKSQRVRSGGRMVPYTDGARQTSTPIRVAR